MPISKIKTDGIQDAAVTTAKVADDAVNSAKIGVDVIAAEDLAANSITVSEISDDAVTSAKIATGAVVADGLGNDAVTSEKIATGAVVTDGLGANAVTTAKIANTVNLGRRNMLHNGEMQISTRDTSFTGVQAPAYCLDRWHSQISGVTSKGICTITQDSDAPVGFSKSLKVAVTTADTSLDAWAEYAIQQRFEGQDLQRLCKGTSSTKDVTISFWVKSSLTGTYILEMLDDDNGSRHINKSYTINTANTWEYKSITFAGDTSGVLDDDTAKSMTVAWCLAGGSNFQGGGLQTSWGSLAQTKRQDGQVNFFATSGNTFLITGCQMEIGDTATQYEHRTYAEEKHLCARYYVQVGSGHFAGYQNGVYNAVCTIPLVTPLRANPTITASGTRHIWRHNGFNTISSSTVTSSSSNFNDNGKHRFSLEINTDGGGGGVNGYVACVYYSGLYLDAEL